MVEYAAMSPRHFAREFKKTTSMIGRRTHRMSKLTDLDDPIKVRYAEQMCTELGATIDNADHIVDSIIKRFI